MKKGRIGGKLAWNVRALVILLAAMVGVYLVAGCGGGNQSTSGTSGEQPATSASASAQGQPDPCSLVTKAEVAAALGTTVADPTTKQTADFNYCEWSSSDSQTRFSIAVPVLTTDAATDFDNTKSGSSGMGNIADIPGVGDQAFFVSNELWVLKDGKVFSFQGLLMPEDAQTKQIATTLMTKAAGRA